MENNLVFLWKTLSILPRCTVKEIISKFLHDSHESTFVGVGGRSTAAATSKMERFVIIVNGWKPLIIIDVAADLDPPPFNKV